MNIKGPDNYFDNVIKRGDEASGSFLNACNEGNKSSKAHYLNILNQDGGIEINQHPEHTHVKKLKAAKETIDGVGTKVEIYTNQFENIFQARQKGQYKLGEDTIKIDGDTAKEQATELRERMLMDLIAMNSDDLRGGELAIGATNIIDINHLTGLRGHLFQDSMSEAMKRVIQKTGIAMTAGETAVLGEAPKTTYLHEKIKEMSEKIKEILSANAYNMQDSDPGDHNWEEKRNYNKIHHEIVDVLNKGENNINVKMEEISFNIGGTCLGLATDHNKLIPLEDGQVIIGFQERPANGIIGPRSNGITKIREDMKTIMGHGRENTTFEDFMEKIGAEKSEKIPEGVKNICAGKKMRDIATGKTTVFNPFIADTLLGGVESEPKVGISKIIHVTGNPLKKISEGINKDKEGIYTIHLDVSEMPTPQIITLLQVALDIPDEQAMNKWNMGVPYAIVCNSIDAHTIIEEAKINNIHAKKIGSIKKQEIGEEGKNAIAGVGFNKSNMTF